MALKNLRSRRFPDPRSLPIAVKLGILLAIVLLIAGFFTDTAVRNVVAEGQQDVVLDDLETISRSNARRIVDVLFQEIQSLESFAQNEQMQDQLRVILANQAGLVDTIAIDGLINRETRVFQTTNVEFINVAVVDANGKVRSLHPYEPTVAPPEDLAGEVWFNRSYRSGRAAPGDVYVSSPITDHITNSEFIHIGVPIFNNQNPEDILGIVYAIWDMSNVLDITEVGENRESLVVESNGNVLISGADEFSFGDPFTADLALSFIGDANGSLHYTDETGREWLYGHTNISTFLENQPDFRQLRWTVVVRQPVSAVQSNVSELSNSLRVVIGASSLVVTLVIALFAYILLLPLARLTRAASTLQAGDLNAPIPVLPSDEVGRLADVFRALVGQLVARLGELRAAVQVTRATSLTLDVNQMLSDVARAIGGQFNYPDVRLYLTDPSARRAQLQAASGGEAERLLRASHRLTVDETTLAGRAMLLNETQTAAANGTAEVAIPLLAGNRSLGVLHVTSPRTGGFRDEEIDILRLVTDQISASIANARLFEQSQSSLAEIETLNRRLTRDAWEEYIGEGDAIRHTRDPEANWPLAQIGGGGRLSTEIRAEVIATPDGRSVLTVPLILRGESVGSLAVSRPSGVRWSSDEIALLESVAARMSMIAEGIRLVDESNRRAMREQRVNEVSANLLARATSVESVLRNALGELGGALGSERVSLRLGTAPDADRPPTIAEPERRKSLPPRRPRPVEDDKGGNGSSD